MIDKLGGWWCRTFLCHSRSVRLCASIHTRLRIICWSFSRSSKVLTQKQTTSHIWKITHEAANEPHIFNDWTEPTGHNPQLSGAVPFAEPNWNKLTSTSLYGADLTDSTNLGARRIASSFWMTTWPGTFSFQLSFWRSVEQYRDPQKFSSIQLRPLLTLRAWLRSSSISMRRN